MTPERWQRIEEIFSIAVELSASERTKYLKEVCVDDSDLLREVETLLEQTSSSSIERIVGDAAVFFDSDNEKKLVGRALDTYKIIREIGTGGMGRVYLAEDTRLNRRVAIKVLPPSFSLDPQRVARFHQEAQAASAINHPNILTVHELGTSNDVHFIVTEFVEGETLAQIVKKKAIPYSEAIEFGVQIAEALQEAHHAGIMHRDIKSGNIMIDRRGQVKVLDFGLSKVSQIDPAYLSNKAAKQFDTISGMILGTVDYMSPEQATGKTVDHRTDLFSLGVVLYEMVSGRLPFSGDTTLKTIDQIVRSDPQPLSGGMEPVPWDFERIVRKCLEKAPERRYQSAREIAIDLRNLKRDIDSGEKIRMSTDQIRPAFFKRSTLLIAVPLLFVAVVLFFLVRSYSRTEQPPPPRITFSQLTDLPGLELFPSISPDGNSFIYGSRGDIYTQRTGGKNAVNLTPDSPEVDEQPSFSPDGSKIAFRSDRQGGGIFMMGATGESVKRLTNFGYAPAWSPNAEEIAFTTERSVYPLGRLISISNLYAVNLKTGKRRLIGDHDALQPSWSPNGHRIAFWGSEGGKLDLWTVSADGAGIEAVTKDDFVDWNPVWSVDGRYLYFLSDRGGSMNLWRILIDEKTGKVNGTPEAITTPALYTQHISFSRDGRRMSYVQFLQSTNIRKIKFDAETETAEAADPAWVTQGSTYATNPHVSPDGEWIVFDARGKNQEDLSVIRTDGTGFRQLTDDAFKDRRPQWSPDGSRIAFYSDRTGRHQIHTIRPDGSDMQQLTNDPRGNVIPSWSPDGKMLSICLFAGPTQLMEIVGSKAVVSPQRLPPLGEKEEWFIGVSWSPDGKKIAGWRGLNNGPHGGIHLYSLESKQYRKLSGSGFNPIWLQDGNRILFESQGKLLILEVSSGNIRELFSVLPDEIDGFSISPDNRFIYIGVAKKEADVWLMSMN